MLDYDVFTREGRKSVYIWYNKMEKFFITFINTNFNVHLWKTNHIFCSWKYEYQSNINETFWKTCYDINLYKNKYKTEFNLGQGILKT